MPDGKHCPDCGGKIGVWTAKLAWLRGGKIACPHCHSGLAYDMKAADSIATLIAFVAIWIATGILRALPIPWGIDEVWIEVAFFLLALPAVALWSAAYLRGHRPLRPREAQPSRGRGGRWPK